MRALSGIGEEKKALVLAALDRPIWHAGAASFLHAYTSNVRAGRLYEKLGFVIRARPVLTVLRRA